MKLIIIFLMIFSVIGCNNLSATSNTFEKEKREVPKPNPIFEILLYADGSTFEAGNSLHFKLNDSGLVEFDVVVEGKIDSTDRKFLFKRINSSLSKEDFNKLKLILKKIASSKNFKKKYVIKEATMDTLHIFTILFKENDIIKKKIIKDADIAIIEKQGADGNPVLLDKLIKEIDLIREKIIKEKDKEIPERIIS